jgi:thiamine biosynthesis lipoprotein
MADQRSWRHGFTVLSSVCCALALSASVQHPSAPARVEASDDAMGTTFSIVLYGPDRARLQAAADAAFEEVHRLDRLLSNYDTRSEWSAVNRGAAQHPVAVSAEVFALIAACLDYSRRSEGAFDITVGPLMKVWGFYKGEGALPSATEIASARRLIGATHVTLDARARTVAFDMPGVELDPGGIGKGYAVDRMVAILKQHGVTSARVSGGGSSIYGLGAPPDTPDGWLTPIRDPADPHHSVAEVRLKNMSLSTSGGYEKFFRANGQIYAHIMDPRTGVPARGTAAVSVMAPRTLDSEAWTKPYFVNGRTWTVSHVAAGFRVFFCESGQPCGWVTP